MVKPKNPELLCDQKHFKVPPRLEQPELRASVRLLFYANANVTKPVAS